MHRIPPEPVVVRWRVDLELSAIRLGEQLRNQPGRQVDVGDSNSRELLGLGVGVEARNAFDVERDRESGHRERRVHDRIGGSRGVRVDRPLDDRHAGRTGCGVGNDPTRRAVSDGYVRERREGSARAQHRLPTCDGRSGQFVPSDAAFGRTQRAWRIDGIELDRDRNAIGPCRRRQRGREHTVVLRAIVEGCPCVLEGRCASRYDDDPALGDPSLVAHQLHTLSAPESRRLDTGEHLEEFGATSIVARDCIGLVGGDDVEVGVQPVVQRSAGSG